MYDGSSSGGLDLGLADSSLALGMSTEPAVSLCVHGDDGVNGLSLQPVGQLCSGTSGGGERCDSDALELMAESPIANPEASQGHAVVESPCLLGARDVASAAGSGSSGSEGSWLPSPEGAVAPAAGTCASASAANLA